MMKKYETRRKSIKEIINLPWGFVLRRPNREKGTLVVRKREGAKEDLFDKERSVEISRES